MTVQMKKYTVQPGKFSARPLLFRMDLGRNPSGAWKIQLLDGWDYELPTNQSQWLKLCGETYNPVNRDKNAVMLAARYYQGKIQIAPYYNINGARLGADGPDTPDAMKPEWPIIEVKPKRDIFFGYKAEGARVTTTVIASGERRLHRITHPGVGCTQYEVNFYAGGSVPAVQEISVTKGRLQVLQFGDDGGLLV